MFRPCCRLAALQRFKYQSVQNRDSRVHIRSIAKSTAPLVKHDTRFELTLYCIELCTESPSVETCDILQLADITLNACQLEAQRTLADLSGMRSHA